MINFKDKKTIAGIGLILAYAVLAILGGMRSELYVLTYIALPSCYAFLYVKFGEKTGLGLSFLLALACAAVGGMNSLVFSGIYALFAFAVYYIMGFEGQQFKKLSLVVLVALLLLISALMILDSVSGGPGFIEELNLLMKNAEFMDQLGDALAKSSPGAEALLQDQNVLKLAISTLLPLFLFLTAVVISLVNYSVVNALRRTIDKNIEAIAPIWKLYVPYPLVFSLVLIGMAGMLMPNIERSFGGGLFISAFLLNSVFFVMQGLFLLAFFLRGYGVNPKYITAICAITFIVSFLFGLRLVFTILLYGGLLDLLFDIRKLRKRGIGK